MTYYDHKSTLSHSISIAPRERRHSPFGHAPTRQLSTFQSSNHQRFIIYFTYDQPDRGDSSRKGFGLTHSSIGDVNVDRPAVGFTHLIRATCETATNVRVYTTSYPRLCSSVPPRAPDQSRSHLSHFLPWLPNTNRKSM
jgi:hypothetical protein